MERAGQPRVERRFGNRYGLIYVDFKTLKRTPKLSAQWFREAARRNAVV
jgi:beta-glucosidase